MTGFLTLTVALTLAPGQADGVLLRWKLKEGDVFYSKSISVNEQAMTVMGMDVEQKQEATVVQKYKVLKADEKGYQLEQTTIQSVTTATGPGADAGLGSLDAKMKGTVLTFTLSPEFTVTKVEGVSELAKKLSEDSNPLLKTIIDSMISDAMLKKGVEDMFDSGPKTPVKPGDEWKKDDTMPLGPLGEMALKAEYKYTGRKDEKDLISFTAKATYSAPKVANGDGPFTITKADLKSDKVDGTIEFDPKTSRVLKTSMAMTMSGTMTIKFAGQEIETTIKQKQKTSSELSDKNPVVD